MTRAEAEELFGLLVARSDIARYSRHIPGFWEAWSRGAADEAAGILRRFLEDERRSSQLGAQPVLAEVLLEKLDALVGRGGAPSAE